MYTPLSSVINGASSGGFSIEYSATVFPVATPSALSYTAVTLASSNMSNGPSYFVPFCAVELDPSSL